MLAGVRVSAGVLISAGVVHHLIAGILLLVAGILLLVAVKPAAELLGERGERSSERS